MANPIQNALKNQQNQQDPDPNAAKTGSDHAPQVGERHHSIQEANTVGTGEPYNDERYLARSAPCTYTFRDGQQIKAPDGVFYASTEEQYNELEAAVRVGNLRRYKPGVPVSSKQVPPSTDPNKRVE